MLQTNKQSKKPIQMESAQRWATNHVLTPDGKTTDLRGCMLEREARRRRGGCLGDPQEENESKEENRERMPERERETEFLSKGLGRK